MNALEAGLLLAGAGVVLNAIASYSNSRKIQYLEEQQMAGKTAVLGAISVLMTAIANEKQELKDARAEEKARQDALIAAAQEGQDLTDVITALEEATAQVQGIIERPAPVVENPEFTEPEAPAEGNGSTPVEGEGTGEVAGGVLPEETSTETGPTGEPVIDGSV